MLSRGANPSTDARFTSSLALSQPIAVAMSPRTSLSSEQGSLMIEVIMGALILAFATFAIFNGLEGAQATGRMNKERSVSSTLAQQDIERLRAFPITSLSNYSQ